MIAAMLVLKSSTAERRMDVEDYVATASVPPLCCGIAVAYIFKSRTFRPVRCRAALSLRLKSPPCHLRVHLPPHRILQSPRPQSCRHRCSVP